MTQHGVSVSKTLPYAITLGHGFAGALGSALGEIGRGLCRAAVREALCQVELSLVEQLVSAFKGPPLRSPLIRHAPQISHI